MRKLFVLGIVTMFLMASLSYGADFVNAGPGDTTKTGKLTKNEDVSDPTVYIKEKGKSYHKRNCKLVKQGKRGIKLSEALDRGLKPCHVCKPPAATDPIVYIKKEGKKYHKKDCAHVKKGKIAIRLNEAIKKGFTPCAVCKPPAKAPAGKKKT